MEHRKLVLPEFLNDQGYLFGGNLLKWVDESAYITASLEFPGNRLVTVSLSEVNFKNPIQPGEMLCFHNHRLLHGRTAFDLGGGGRRRLLGCYLDIEELHSARAVLARR